MIENLKSLACFAILGAFQNPFALSIFFRKVQIPPQLQLLGT